MASSLKAGDSFPQGVTFSYVAPTGDADLGVCGMPTKYDASKEFQNKKVVLVGVPGAFTPTCQEQHVPSYIQNLEKLKAKGVDQIIVIASNDAWVMSAWGKANGIKDDSILFMSDEGLAFGNKVGLTQGDRLQRFLIIVDNGKVVYNETDSKRGSIEFSGAQAALAKL